MDITHAAARELARLKQDCDKCQHPKGGGRHTCGAVKLVKGPTRAEFDRVMAMSDTDLMNALDVPMGDRWTKRAEFQEVWRRYTNLKKELKEYHDRGY